MTGAAFALDVYGGERLRFSDAEFLVKADASSMNGAFALVEEIEPLDTPRHVHENQDEYFFVLEGEHVFEVGDESFVVGPGGFVAAPGASRTRIVVSSREPAAS